MRDMSLVLVALHRLLHRAPGRLGHVWARGCAARVLGVSWKGHPSKTTENFRNSPQKERYRTGRVNLFRGF
jgi:hypothetical protein